MKSSIYFLIITGLFAFAAGCGEDSPTESTPQQKLVLNGSIFQWNHGSNKLLKFGMRGAGRDEAFSYGTIMADGSFSIVVSAPPRTLLRPIKNIYNAAEGRDSLYISDTTALYFEGYPIAYEGMNYMGLIYWVAFVRGDPSALYSDTYYERYFYFSRPVTVKGRVYDIEINHYISFDFTAEAGWNKLYLRYAQNSDPTYINNCPESGFSFYEFEGLATPDNN